MHDVGCAVGCLAAIVLPALVFIFIRIQTDTKSAAKKVSDAAAADAAESRERSMRGKRITDLLDLLSRTTEPDRVLDEIRTLMKGRQVGYFPQLSEPQGWFERAAP